MRSGSEQNTPLPETPEREPHATLDERAETAWKWILRGGGMAALWYVLLVMHGEVALGAWVIIGGLIGLPNALPLSQLVTAWKGEK